MNEPHRISGATELDLYRENQRLSDELSAVTGAMRADDARLRAAAMRIWGGGAFGCDTPDMMADEILTLRQKLAAERAARERAERERDVERHVRVTVEAELKGERKAHEETKKANREAERIFLDELLARRATEADRDRLREALREIAQHPCWLTKMGYTMRCESAKDVGQCSPCHARRALDASGAGEEGE